MNFESYKQIFSESEDICLKSGRSHSFEFDIEDPNSADRVFFTGETGIYYQWKSEPDYQYLYRRIDDSLSTEQAERDQFALDMSANNCNYPKIAYKKIVWPPRFYGHPCVNWSFGISVQAEDLKLLDGGYLHFLIEIRYKKADVAKNIVYTKPDVVACIDIPEGSYPYKRLSGSIELNSPDIASICIYLEGENYDGRLFCESPYLKNDAGHNICSDFAPFTEEKQRFNWLGVNLSRKETPSFKIELNGSVIYDGEIFERCHRYSEWEVKIPVGTAKKGKNLLKFTHTSCYRDVPPYNLHEVGIVSVRRDGLICCPEVASVNKPFPILVRTEKDNVRFTLKDAPEYLRTDCDMICRKAGLNVLYLVCSKVCNSLDFTLVGEMGEIPCSLLRCVEKGEDGVIAGTGDMVYINQNKESFEDYLAWYTSNNIGNLLTIRPTYRWSGSRVADGRLWKETAELLEKMGIKYVHMRDGRELQGCDANPLPSELEGEGFLGRQNHEYDGQMVYWPQREITGNTNEEMFYDLFVRRFLTHGERMNPRYCPENYTVDKGRTFIFRNLSAEPDMEAAASYTVDNLAKTRHGSTRHTGPATLFKYFYQAGYEWTGAELMYASTEVTCASLRGAARTYGGKTGGHLATQWSTTPYDVPEHSKRYRLALYISYMQGLDDINTEEGLWHLEEYYLHAHRHSKECLDHLKEHQDFYRYISTHTRSGKFYTPIAFLNGRFDGWKLFGAKANTWGRPDFKHFDCEESWDLLNIFYPESRPGALYRHPCPIDREIGFYSGTPLSNIDILPIEAESYDYPLLCAIGYNKATDADMDKLYSYVKNGGILLIGLPQLSTTTKRADIESYNMEYISHPFKEMIAPKTVFKKDSISSRPIHICPEIPRGAEVLKYTDSSLPAIYSVKIGQGKVIVVNTKEYAANDAIRPYVEETIRELAKEVVRCEEVWAEGDNYVQFAVYKQEDDSTHIYFISADWYLPQEPVHTARLIIGKDSYDLDISYGRMLKAVISEGVGAWFDCEECDVISLKQDKVTVQGIGKASLFIAKQGKRTIIDVDFTERAVQEITI